MSIPKKRGQAKAGKLGCCSSSSGAALRRDARPYACVADTSGAERCGDSRDDFAVRAMVGSWLKRAGPRRSKARSSRSGVGARQRTDPRNARFAAI